MNFHPSPFENTVSKGENAGNQHFLLFPQCFQPFPKQISIFESLLICHLQMLWTSDDFKGGYLDFSHLTGLKNIYITEIYMENNTNHQ